MIIIIIIMIMIYNYLSLKLICRTLIRTKPSALSFITHDYYGIILLILLRYLVSIENFQNQILIPMLSLHFDINISLHDHVFR